ncbi:coiled-coil domain-containing protein 115 [Malaclemys terrapin pileata]|uniref:coiled-coil domain-containing protein 115 n=1 Tax=Malaclemys terrapin pileata TaxID=2991368 RepID=UPI0023A80E35|nr:coiled-coil domain-containing protein 115 [Malaclemys terrapin pileata]XP_053870879.1 coiled-coil domain-containing protein 115 [Malaclemys terrapin pileata]
MAELALRRELDERLLHLLGALETLQGKRDEFNSCVEQGWFSLSKSRFAMGCKSVSALQYGAHMEPLVRVCASEGESGQVAFQVIPGDGDPSAEAAEGSPAVEEIGPQDQVLRQRKGPGKTADPGPPVEAAPEPDSQKGASSRDPLTWFGILVPQSLRQAQSSFKEGILLAGEIASLQSDIEATRAQYRALLERKRQLLAREG